MTATERILPLLCITIVLSIGLSTLPASASDGTSPARSPDILPPIWPPDGPPELPDWLVPVRSLHVRPTTAAEQEKGYLWKYWGYKQTPPSSPPQEDIRLSEDDNLTIVVPQFAHRPLLGPFEVGFVREGDHLTLKAYFVWSGGVTATMYGRHEYLAHIGRLPAGEYTLLVRYLTGLDSSGDWGDLDEFLEDPDAFDLAHDVTVVPPGHTSPMGTSGSHLIEHQYEHTFTVVPEPGVVTLLALGALALRRRR